MFGELNISFGWKRFEKTEKRSIFGSGNLPPGELTFGHGAFLDGKCIEKNAKLASWRANFLPR